MEHFTELLQINTVQIISDTLLSNRGDNSFTAEVIPECRKSHATLRPIFLAQKKKIKNGST